MHSHICECCLEPHIWIFLMLLHYHCFCCPTQETIIHDPNFQNGPAKNKDWMCFLILSNLFLKAEWKQVVFSVFKGDELWTVIWIWLWLSRYNCSHESWLNCRKSYAIFRWSLWASEVLLFSENHMILELIL